MISSLSRGLLGQLPGLDSNQDKENQNPLAPPHNSFQGKLFAHPGADRRTAGRTSGSEVESPADPDLAVLVAAWPTLPPYIRAAVRALVATASPTPPPGAGPSGGG